MELAMRSSTSAIVLAIVLGVASGPTPVRAAPPDEKGKICRMEQQCHWENFKKICTYVKVCR
jgi:hypothetical protein